MEVVQFVALPQVPLEVHEYAVLPWHSVWLGAHTPMHVPALHVWLLVVQLVEFVHVPLLHVWMVLPEHCTEPGEHDPVH